MNDLEVEDALRRAEKAIESDGVSVDPVTALALIRELVLLVKWLRGRNG